jgi:hypothetical protein
MVKVNKVGFKDENPVLSIILMDRKTRDAVKVELGGLVTVSKNDLTLEAVVMPQFKDLIGKGVVVNVVLAKALQIKEGDEVELKPFTPPEGQMQPRFPRSFFN